MKKNWLKYFFLKRYEWWNVLRMICSQSMKRFQNNNNQRCLWISRLIFSDSFGIKRNVFEKKSCQTTHHRLLLFIKNKSKTNTRSSIRSHWQVEIISWWNTKWKLNNNDLTYFYLNSSIVAARLNPLFEVEEKKMQADATLTNRLIFNI